MPSVKPFKFRGLPSYTKEQVAVLGGLSTYLSYHPFNRRFVRQLAKELEEVVKAPFKFAAPDLITTPASELAHLFPEQTCLLVVGAAPSEHKILVDLDGGIAALCIDKLLGGDGNASRMQRPLTDIEQGVLSFVLLKVLASFHSNWERGREISLTLDRFASTVDEVQDVVNDEANFYVMAMKLSVGKRVGYLRVAIPERLVTASFLSPPNPEPPTPEEFGYMRGVLQGLGDSWFWGHVEAATMDLSTDDISALEVGDIILIENHQLSLGAAGVEGQATIKLGTGVNGGLAGTLVNEGDLVKFHISQIVKQQEPSTHTELPENEMADAEDAPLEGGEDLEMAPPAGPDDNLEETDGLLADVPAPVVVELGRLKMNTSQVVRLRAGQILRLPRGPNDPVNLVVNGKLFARGELIEVDGELGVRLLQVVGS